MSRSMTLAYSVELLAMARAVRSFWLLKGAAAVLSMMQFTAGWPRMDPLSST